MNRERERAAKDRRRRLSSRLEVALESLEARRLLATSPTSLASASNSAFINNSVTGASSGVSTSGTTTGTTTGTTSGTTTGTGASVLGGINVVPIAITQPAPKAPPYGPIKYIHTNTGAAYEVAITSGPGVVLAKPLTHGQFAITLLGTTSASQVSITPKLIRGRYNGSALQIGAINVRSGQLGSINAGTYADLQGAITPLSGTVSALSFDALGPNAQIVVNGAVGGLTIAGNATLGPSGRVIVPGPASIGGTLVNGGFFASNGLTVGGDVGNATGATLADAGLLTTGGGLGDSGLLSATGLTIGANVFLTPGVTLTLAGSSPVVVGGNMVIDPGANLHFVGDLTNPLTVNGSLVISGGSLTVDRDATAGLAIGQNLILNGGGSLDIGRNVSALTVGGNLDSSGVGQLNVGGNINKLSVQGEIIGSGANDITVGLSVFEFQVLGGAPNQGGVQSLDMRVGKNLQAVDIAHGVFNSFISAGVLIDGSGSPNTGGGNIGPDGVVAVFDSTIMAGFVIENFTIGGDVKSDQPTNPAGKPTRILAGIDRQGNLEDGAVIDNFVITGSLIDSVIAASVKPKTGTSYSTPPTGTIDTGYVNGPSDVRENYTSTISDLNAGYDYLTGFVNPSFAPTPLSPATIATTLPGTLPIPLPSQRTVFVNVAQTSPHVAGTDYAGIYATNTTGVLVGLLPKR